MKEEGREGGREEVKKERREGKPNQGANIVIPKPDAFLPSLLLSFLSSAFSCPGMHTPPLHGDYEAQRHWMEVTLHVPLRDWYVLPPSLPPSLPCRLDVCISSRSIHFLPFSSLTLPVVLVTLPLLPPSPPPPPPTPLSPPTYRSVRTRSEATS